MQNTWMVLVPPLLVVILAATTRRVFVSLLTGIFSALLVAHDFSLTKVLPDMVKRIWHTTELGTITSWQAFWNTWYLFICLFLILLGIVITMLQHSGGAYAYGNVVSSRLKNKRQAEASSLLLSLFFFIDDYFSCLTVGSVMQPITDRFKIPRVKLGLLVNAMGAPLVVLLPFSSWAAEIIMQIRQSGISAIARTGTLVVADPFYVYMNVIPFMFYSFIAILSIWFIVYKQISFGLYDKHARVAEQTGNLFAGKMPVAKRTKDLSEEQIKRSSILDFLIPIGTLFVSAMIAILYFGDWQCFGGGNSLMVALQNSKIAAALFVGSVITLLVSTPYLVSRKKLLPGQLPGIFWEGIMLLGPSVGVLILIWTLSGLLRTDLATGQYLASLLIGKINIAYLPLMFFVVAIITSSTMGSAWGTIGIHIPIAVPMLASLLHLQAPVFVASVPVLFPLLGAIVSGAVIGNHLSPISDTMLMSSTSSGSYHIDLVKTQFSFTLPCIIASAVAFLIAGFLASHVSIYVNMLVSLSAGILLSGFIFLFLHARAKNNRS